MPPRIATHIGSPNPSRLRLAQQAGVTDIVTGPPEGEASLSLEGWLDLKRQVEATGMKLSVIESLPLSNRVMLGQPGRDEDIEVYLKKLRLMGQAGIHIHCYNWMPMLHVVRTSWTLPVRGGAMANGYDHELMRQAPLTDAGLVGEEQLWSSLEYFLRAVLPVAEEVNVQLGMHPDDPPISPIRGIARIIISPENYQRMIDLVPSPMNGVTFCQGCFAEMGADVPAAIRQFGRQNKLFFAHFRTVTGHMPRFVEAFHDEGDVDMLAAMKAYYEVGFEGPMRPDHFPVMEGEEPIPGAWAVKGRLFAIGYMRGLMQAVENPPKP